MVVGREVCEEITNNGVLEPKVKPRLTLLDASIEERVGAVVTDDAEYSTPI